jgi:hypothetical protein
MDEEQRQRSEQFARNFGAREFLRLGCLFMTLPIVGLLLGLAFKNAGIIVIFMVLFWAVLWLAPYWQPAYALVYKAMGNKNIPAELPKHRWKWWHYIPIALKVIILLAVLRLGIQLLFQ